MPSAVQPHTPLDSDQPTATPGFLRRAPAWLISLSIHTLGLALLILAMTLVPNRTGVVCRPGLPGSSAKPLAALPTEPQDDTLTAEDRCLRDFTVITILDLALGQLDAAATPHLTDPATPGDGLGEQLTPGNSDGYMWPDKDSAEKPAQLGVDLPFDRDAFDPGIHGECHRLCGGCRADFTVADLALPWFAQHQEPDGHWDTVKYGATADSRCDTAATALVVLTFLNLGQTDRRGQYKETVRNALEWLILRQDKDGCIQPGANGKEIGYGPGYHHAIAGVALAEAYAQSKSDWLKTAAQKAVDYSVHHQHQANGQRGGWRYQPGAPGDLSVSTWFILQLKCARLARLSVPQEAFEGAFHFLNTVEVPTPKIAAAAAPAAAPVSPASVPSFSYDLTKRAAAATSPICTLMGITDRLTLGWPAADYAAAYDAAIDQLGLPAWKDDGADLDPHALWFSAYIAFQLQGDRWKAWKTAYNTEIFPRQLTAGPNKGTFDPVGKYAHLGRVFNTALLVHCDQFYYCYGTYVPRPARPPSH